MRAVKREGYYRIGEVSKITGISKDTLHFYNKIGLVVPDYTDPENQYRYYSRWNMWQLDIVTICRKLSIPLEQVKRILVLRDNEEIVELMMSYRAEALRQSAYYRQVADDLLWYKEEHQRILEKMHSSEIQVKWFPAETVIAGGRKRDAISYHANLQEASKDALAQANSIRRKYGYMLDLASIGEGRVIKRREYLKLPEVDLSSIPPENQYTLPEGWYATFTVQIQDEKADFSPFAAWLETNGEEIELLFAEEVGLHFFAYLDVYACEVKGFLKNQKRGLTV